MLYNKSPGLKFRGCDMVRNLILSCYMDHPLDYQEHMYRTHWLFPFELKFGTEMDKVLL